MRDHAKPNGRAPVTGLPYGSADVTHMVDLAAGALAQADGIGVGEARRAIVDSYKAAVAPALLNDLLAEPSVSSTMPLLRQVVRRLVQLPRDSAIRRLAVRCYRGWRWLSDESVQGTELWSKRLPDADAAFAPVGAFLRGPKP